jgi:GNAT superfamily N-acetyltransferase
MSTPALRISTDPQTLDLAMVHAFLSSQTPWARGMPLATLKRAIGHSLCFGGYLGETQVAFARVVSDYATFAYLVDVFVLPAYRRRGYADQLLGAVRAHPGLQGLRRFMLATNDAHGLYLRHGFAPPARPQNLMEIYVPDIYTATIDERSEEPDQ